MSDSQKVTFGGGQRALIRALIEHWRKEANTAGAVSSLCAAEWDKATLAARHNQYLTCADELTKVLESGDLPARLGFQVRV